jgi:hypothetical protein
MHLSLVKFIFFIQLTINFRDCTPVQFQRLISNLKLKRDGGNAVDTSPIFQNANHLESPVNQVTPNSNDGTTPITSSLVAPLLNNVSFPINEPTSEITNKTNISESTSSTISPISSSTISSASDSTLTEKSTTGFSEIKDDNLLTSFTSENQETTTNMEDSLIHFISDMPEAE